MHRPAGKRGVSDEPEMNIDVMADGYSGGGQCDL